SGSAIIRITSFSSGNVCVLAVSLAVSDAESRRISAGLREDLREDLGMWNGEEVAGSRKELQMQAVREGGAGARHRGVVQGSPQPTMFGRNICIAFQRRSSLPSMLDNLLKALSRSAPKKHTAAPAVPMKGDKVLET